MKFKNSLFTAKGEHRAVVELTSLQTLWFNTGSLCNITCENCYMESSPTNDRLAYLTIADIEYYLTEIKEEFLKVEEIGFTGGEPFMNNDLIKMLEKTLQEGYRVLVLTNAMRPFLNKREHIYDILMNYPEHLTLRISIDHYTKNLHEMVRGKGSWAPMLEGIKWLNDIGAKITVAGRTCWNESESNSREGYSKLFSTECISINACDPKELILFPEMSDSSDVPEITKNCWDILNIKPESLMCANSRMIVKHKNSGSTSVMPCTLLPYDSAFRLGKRLINSKRIVSLNHPNCAKFCVLGGASCGNG